MRIDSATNQTRWIWDQTVQPRQEVAGEQEPDGDADDMVKKTAAAPAAQQVNPQGVGTRINLLA
jgi:hypothetical protein